MNFGGFLDASTGNGRIMPDLQYLNHVSNVDNGKGSDGLPSPDGLTFGLQHHHPLSKSMFSSPGLSLALQTGAGGENHCDLNDIIGGGVLGGGENRYEGVAPNRRSRGDLYEHDSRSGSDNLDGVASGDDQDATDNVNRPPRKKRYHRHTPQQIQELEALFKECPHPDEKQRLELSRRLCLETRQVKFWFQNRRTQMKTQLERHENSLLRQENDKLRAENMSLRDAMRSTICTTCGSSATIGEISLEEQHLRIENARMKDELDRVCALTGKFLGRPVSSLPPAIHGSSLELGMGGGNNVFGVGYPPDFGISGDVTLGGGQQARPGLGGVDRSLERTMLLELALAAMDELLKMAQTDEPLWIQGGAGGGRELLNEEEYVRAFSPPCIGMRPGGFVSEASRESGVAIINSLSLVETLMDSNRWAEMFPCLIARTAITDVISGGMGGTKNGALQLMEAELQVLSPLVPVRVVNFLRFSKQHAEGVWAVVDVSVDSIRDDASPSAAASSLVSCRRLPSGCVVQDLPNGYSKVTWVEHAEYDNTLIHQLYRPLISSGMGFGAPRWIATLQRHSQCLVSSAVPARDHPTAAITAGGRRSMLKLAQRMTVNFCSGVCASTVHKWNKLSGGNVDEDVRVMTRNSMDDPGEPPGTVLSAATSVWLPTSPQLLFDFLRDSQLRSEWDILSNGGPMQEMAHVTKGQDPGNCVSLLRASAMTTSQSSMLILQDTCVDPSGSLVVYAPVDIPAMHAVMNGGDSAYVALLPSGFAIVPDGPGSRNGPGGSLLTVAFQILVSNLPTAKLTVESVETVNNLISCTIQKIKAALQCESRRQLP